MTDSNTRIETRLEKAERACVDAALKAFDPPFASRIHAWMNAARELVDAVKELEEDEEPTVPDVPSVRKIRCPE